MSAITMLESSILKLGLSELHARERENSRPARVIQKLFMCFM